MDKTSKQKLTIILAIVFSAIIIFFAINYTKKDSSANNNERDTVVEENINNVSVVDGKQIIEIKAKGGYSPVHSVAKAGIPTILRVNTNGTFDCSSSIRIPSLNIGKNLPMSGTTDIDLGNPKQGILQGTCGMGMYPFEINFQT
jgi:plastocyanin domain-containing protein